MENIVLVNETFSLMRVSIFIQKISAATAQKREQQQQEQQRVSAY